MANDVFGTIITTASGDPLYSLSVCGPAPSVMTDGGLRVEVPHGLDALAAADTIVVLPWWIPARCPPRCSTRCGGQVAGKRILSLCTGAFVLAAAGLLDGHTATTHWSECADLARRYPRVSVDPKVLYVDEGNLLTSAGSAASLDLCLHVVQRDHGTEIAAKVARDLVVPLHRPGGQAQYIETPMPPLDDGDLFADTIGWLREHLAEPVTVADLAERAAMSPRTFARRFLASTGTTPLQWISPSASGSPSACSRPPSCPSTRSRRRAASAPRTTCASTSAARCAPRRRPTAARSAPPRRPCRRADAPPGGPDPPGP